MRKTAAPGSFRIGFALVVLIPLLTLAPAQSVPFRQTGREAAVDAFAVREPALLENGNLPLIVELEGPAVAEAMVAEQAAIAGTLSRSWQSAKPLNLSTARAVSHRLRVQAEQSTLIRRLNLLGGVEVVGSTDTVLNAVFVRIPHHRYEEVGRLPGVRKVYFSRSYRMALDYVPGVHNAQGMWIKAGGSARAGEGVRIGVIDTGIDINNPMLQDDSLTPPSGFPTGDTAYTNKKVIVARNYVLAQYGYQAQSVNSAMDEVGHGTFVSACAAGKQTVAPSGTIGGMAQGAFLGSYKVFGTPGINESAYSGAIIAAVNDAVNDGMNVLNLSLGALAYTPAAEDAESRALANAIASGVVVVLAAGNDGPGNFTISNPGSMPEAITVGAVSNARDFVYRLRATAPAPVPSNLQNVTYVPGEGLSLDRKISALIVDVSTLDPEGTACSGLASGSLTGKVALISRGTCPFLNKAVNAASAGAVAAIVYAANPGDQAIIMGGTAPSPIPAVMVSNADGTALKSRIGADPAQAAVEIDVAAPVSITPRILSSFSSRGPSPDFDLKPDLVAVGQNVYSAAQKNDPNGALYNSSRFMESQGTSFATPMVAGAAAVIKQIRPDFTPLDVKSALTTTADRNLTLPGGTAPNLLQAGAGLLDMASAATVGATFSPANLSFGTTAYSPGMSLTRSFEIKNVSSTSDSFGITVQPLVLGPSVVLSTANTGSIASGAKVTVDVAIQPSSPVTGAFQGFITVQSANTDSIYRIPYWSGIYVPDSSRVLSVSSSTGAASGVFRTLEEAIGNAQPGNVIEIGDSATYQVATTVAVNNDGLPLHGLTIRAASGQTPTLTGSGTGQSAALLIIGLRNVLLQGLRISGGYIGVEVLQPAQSLPTSVAIDHCTITNMQDLSDGLGVYALGATVTITQSTVSLCGDYGIYAGSGTTLTLSKSSVTSNQYASGLRANKSNVQVLDSALDDNYGSGATLTSCSGTIERSSFSRNVDSYYYGDGLVIVGGSFTLSGNTIEGNAFRGVALFSPSSGLAGPVASLAHNTVRGNTGFGILANPGKDVVLEGNLIKANGGAGVAEAGGSSVLAVNNIISKTTSWSPSSATTYPGYGFYVTGASSARIVNNTIHGNDTGVSLATSGTCEVWNTIFDSNTRDVFDVPAGSVQYSLVKDSALASGTNLTGDPKLVDPGNDNCSLGEGSAALDAGSNAANDLPFLDYNRKLRVASSASRPGEGKVDIGAVESGSAYPLVFPLLANGQQPSLGDDLITGFAVLNSGTDSAQTVFAGYGPTGQPLSGTTNPFTRTFEAGTQVPILGHQLLGFDFTASSIGSVLASSASRMTGFFLLFDRDFARFADGVDVSDDAATSLTFLRHLNDSSSHTSYCLFNPGVEAANVTATLYDTSGKAVGISKGSSIAAKGQSVFSFDGATLSSGYVRVRSDRPVAGLELFGNAANLSALRAVAAGTDGLLYFPHFAVNSGYSTAIVILNTTGDASNLVLTAYNGDGSRIGAPASRALAANGQLFETVASLFGIGSSGLSTGYVVATSDKGGIAGYTGFLYDDGRVQSSAAVPATSVPRTELIFSHIAHQVAAGAGGTYQTGIALLNPFGVPVQYTMKVFDGNGVKKAEITSTIGAGEKIAKVLSHPSAGAGFFTQELPLSGGHIEVTSDVGLIGFELFYTEDVSQLASVPAQTSN